MAAFGDLSYMSRYGRRRRRAFTPYDPTVPTGSYDPSLDAALGATQRGLQDTEADYQTQSQRGLVDYGLQRGQLELGAGRSLTDLAQARTRGQEDYTRNIGLLTRRYGQLATSQQEQQNAAGVLGGGAVLEAATKRAANQAIERQPIDTGWQRQQADISMQEARTREDLTSGLGQLGLGYQRSSDDALSGLTRARREGTQFGLDTNAQKLFQATQAGYVAPTRPKNEFTTRAGVPYRVIKIGRRSVRVDQYGRRI